MAKGLLATQEADQRRLAALRSEQAARAALRSSEASNAEASHREQQALREAAFAKEETPYAYMNFSMGPPQSGLVQTPENPGLMGGPQYQSSDLPSGMTPLDVQEMLDYQRQAGTQEITAVPYNVGFRPGQQPTLLNQQQMPGSRLPRSLVQSSDSGLMSGRQPTPLIDSGQGMVIDNSNTNQVSRSVPQLNSMQRPTLSGKTIQPLSEYASLEPDPQEMPTLPQEQNIYSTPPLSRDEVMSLDREIMTQADYPGIHGTDQEKASKALDKHFPGNTIMKAVMMAQFKHESGDFDPTTIEDTTKKHKGIGLMQFTNEGDSYPKKRGWKAEDGRVLGEYQRTAFTKWLRDNGRDMDAYSTVEYIKELLTTEDSAWVEKYHDIGSGHRAKARELLKSGNVAQLSDFITDNLIGPGEPNSTLRKTQKKARRKESGTRATDLGLPPAALYGHFIPSEKKIATKPLKPS